MARRCAPGLIGLGHDGPPPRPGAARRSTASSWSPWPTPAATRTASPAACRCCAGVEELIAAGIDTAVVAVPDRPPRGGRRSRWPRPACTRWSRSRSRRRRRPAERHRRRVRGRAGWSARVGHIERYNPALQALRARLEAGELGDVYQIATRRQGPFPARIADVGVVKDLATHDIDLTAWVAQSRSPRSSAQHRLQAAAASTRTWSPPSGSSPTARSPTTWSTGCRR